jgi:hypothetical protein
VEIILITVLYNTGFLLIFLPSIFFAANARGEWYPSSQEEGRCNKPALFTRLFSILHEEKE